MNEEEEKQLFKNIEYYGNRYIQKDLIGKYNKVDLEKDWWQGSKFIINYCFYRGRRDELSAKYNEFGIQKIEKYFNLNDINNNDESLRKVKDYFDKFEDSLIKDFKKSKDLNGRSNITNINRNKDNYISFVKHLAESENEFVLSLLKEEEIEYKWKNEMKPAKICLNNDKDITMLLSILHYMIKSKERNNLYVYIKGEIENNNIDRVVKELMRLNGVGDKLSNLITRDIILLNDIKNNNSDFLKKAFPIDTWVETLYENINGERENNKEVIKTYFIGKSQEYELNALLIACGLWDIGVKSLEYLLEVLNRQES